MIQVENLRFRYHKGADDVLKGLSFTIPKGEIFGFLGPSGAGKSTAQKILYKILKGYTGAIKVNGKDLQAWGKEYHEMIGVGFELPNHYQKLTGRENLTFFMSFYARKGHYHMEELFEMVGLKHAMNDAVETYSKGMKMRLNFIRAIQHDPQILFFDEPTSGLDPINAHTIKQLILDLKKQGKTIFITTHHMDTADQLCDQVSFIVNGALKVTDQPERLKKAYGKPIVKVQLEEGASEEFPLPGIGFDQGFVQCLQRGEVRSIQTQEASLEEVFIALTGESLKQ